LVKFLQAIVKIEPANSDVEEEKLKDHNSKAARRGTNKDLPSGCQDGNQFRRHFIPTFLKLAAAGSDLLGCCR
jgi:hypothetical protein